MEVVHRDKQRMTADDLLDVSAREHDVELLDGELLPLPFVVGSIGRLRADLGLLIGNHVRRSNLGVMYGPRTGHWLTYDPDTVLTADLSFYRTERAPSPIEEEHFLQTAPDLVILIISPSTLAWRLMTKIVVYLNAGTSLLWIIDPARVNVTVWTNDYRARIVTSDEILDGGDVLPDFSMRVRDIVAGSSPARQEHSG